MIKQDDGSSGRLLFSDGEWVFMAELREWRNSFALLLWLIQWEWTMWRGRVFSITVYCSSRLYFVVHVSCCRVQMFGFHFLFEYFRIVWARTFLWFAARFHGYESMMSQWDICETRITKNYQLRNHPKFGKKWTTPGCGDYFWTGTNTRQCFSSREKRDVSTVFIGSDFRLVCRGSRNEIRL